MGNYRAKAANWLRHVANWISRPRSEVGNNSKFLDLAPTDTADASGVYSNALLAALDNPRVYNIALTGPYGSGKSSIIKSFLKNYDASRTLQISLAAFLPETASTGGEVSRQEIERSILQQMLYGADANKLPFSRFKRIQSPEKWSSTIVSLYIASALFACWHLVQKRGDIVNGTYFLPLDISNWFNFVCFAAGVSFLWLVVHRFYLASFGISLKSVSLKDIEITPETISQESILNRHLDEIIYFFQSTKYDLVVIEDLDRFNNPDIFVTLREINKIVNENSGVKRAIRFLYALRDDMFVNTDRTKFFEFIIPVIPIINSSNSIDKVIEQGKRLSLDDRLDRQFLREVSRYLSDLRLIRNIFNEYAIYVANLETDDENVLDANKLLAILIYKNTFPSDFELLHRGKGNLADILARHDDLIANIEAECKAEISRLEEQIDVAERQLPADLQELRDIYAMAVIQKLPEQANYINLNGIGFVPLNSLANDERVDQFINATSITWRSVQGQQGNVNISGFEKEVNPQKTFDQRKQEVNHKSEAFKETASEAIHSLRAKAATLRVTRFNEIVRQNAKNLEQLFEPFGDNAELARFLVFEGFLDDTYYQYTSLFHAGRLSPSDNKFLIQIRAFINPEPSFQIDNPKEVIAAMRDEDFGQSYVLNVKLVDCLLSDPSLYHEQLKRLFEFFASNFDRSRDFFSAYYSTGTTVSGLLAGLVKAWAGFVPAAIASEAKHLHVAQLLEHLSTADLEAIAKKHPIISQFVSADLQKILTLNTNFEAEQLKALEVEVTDLSSVGGYPAIARFLLEEALYRVSIDNVDFIFRTLLGIEDRASLQRQNYTAVLDAGNAELIAKIERNFDEYLNNVLLVLPENSDESVPAILATINREELEIEHLRAFLKQQTAFIPSLEQVPVRLQAMVFEINKIEASWENCLVYLSSDGHDTDIMTEYLNRGDTAAALSAVPLSDTEQMLPLRQFLIGNDALSDEVYRHYARALPKEFTKFPESISSEKLQILIEERRVSFSHENLSVLSAEGELQLLFVAKNVDRYLQKESEFPLDDDFRERLLGCDIADESKLKIIRAMDPVLLATVPSRAATVGSIIARTGAEFNDIGADTAQAIVSNSKPTGVQISLLNKFQEKLDDQQIRAILASMEEPICDIKPGYGTPRIKSNEANLEFVKWLKARRFISSWSQGDWLGLDDDIRINLFRK